MKKTRLDQLLVERGLVESRNKAQTLIKAGKVLVSDVVITKSGAAIKPDAVIQLKEVPRFVSRGGMKLDDAMTHFDVDCTGLVCADLGASTGGFTDVLCQRDALIVYAIDVGQDQLAKKLTMNPKVVIMDRCNARHLESLPEPIDFIVGDLSFISLSKIIDAMIRIAKPKAKGLLLIKPQFEVGKKGLRAGVVRDEALRTEAIATVISDFKQAGCVVFGHVPSSIAGAKKGNIEELVYVEFPG